MWMWQIMWHRRVFNLLKLEVQKKRLIDKLVEKCRKNIDEKELHSNEMIYKGTLNDHKKDAIFVQYTLYY